MVKKNLFLSALVLFLVCLPLVQLIPRVFASTSSVIVSPNGNSTPLELSATPPYSNFQCVQEYPTPDDVNSSVYMSGENTAYEDNYTVPSPAVPSGATVNNITITYRAKSTGTGIGSHTAIAVVTVDKIKYLQSPAQSVATSWTTYKYTFSNASWTSSMVNALYIGIRLLASTPANWIVACTQIFANITYTVSSGTTLTWAFNSSVSMSSANTRANEFSLNFHSTVTLTEQPTLKKAIQTSFLSAANMVFSDLMKTTKTLSFNPTSTMPFQAVATSLKSLSFNGLSTMNMKSTAYLPPTGPIGSSPIVWLFAGLLVGCLVMFVAFRKRTDDEE